MEINYVAFAVTLVAALMCFGPVRYKTRLHRLPKCARVRTVMPRYRGNRLPR